MKARTKTAVVVRPAFVSQHTAPAVLGFKNERAFLEWLPRSGLRVSERGKDRLVALDDAIEALTGTSTVPDTERSTFDAQPEDAASVLAELGLRPAAIDDPASGARVTTLRRVR